MESAFIGTHNETLSVAVRVSGDWINVMERTGAGDSTEWRISLNTGGSIRVRASGFRQYIRRSPVFLATPNQYLETTQRGGISFDIATQQT